MGRAALYLAIISVQLVASQALAAGPFGSVVVGNWKGGGYTDDRTGVFSHCAAGTAYQSGIYFMVGIKADNSWTLGFAHRDWELKEGEVVPIELTFDGQAKFHVHGVAQSQKLVLVPMPNNSALVAQFRKSNFMSALARGQLFPFKLDSTSQLIPVLALCVERARLSLANIGSLTPSSVPRGVPKVATAPSSLRSEPPPVAPSAELQIEAIELATNFILKTQLQNPKVLSRAETPVEFASFGAAWRSDEAVGAVKIIPGQANVKGIDVAAAVAAADARDCQGKFASGRVSELVDSDVVFRGFATCEDSAGARVAQYFIVPRKKGGFIMFSVISNMKTESARTITEERQLPSFRKAALVAAGG
jgi:hypothetical protein